MVIFDPAFKSKTTKITLKILGCIFVHGVLCLTQVFVHRAFKKVILHFKSNLPVGISLEPT